MTAADTAPSIRLDRYLALLAILLALVLGLLVIGEREKQPPAPPAVVGTLPPTPDPRLAAFVAERNGLLGEHTRLAEALAEAEAALGRAEAEIEALRRENEELRQRLGEAGTARDDLASRLAAAEAERDRLGAEVLALTRSRAALEARIAALEAMPAADDRPGDPALSTAAPAPIRASAPISATNTSPDADPTPLSAIASPPTGATSAANDHLDQDTAEPTPPPLASPPVASRPLASSRVVTPSSASPATSPPATSSPATGTAIAETPATGAPAPGAQAAGTPAEPLTAEANGAPRRLIILDAAADGRSAADGITAYNAGDYPTAEAIWSRLAAAGDRRAQFYLGSILFEGRNAPPDPVMAHVWLSRSVDAGYLPAIEMRRQVRAGLTEAQYERALAIQAGG